MTEGLRVNFSEKEAASEGRPSELLPRGDYHCAITDIELRESQSEKNYGKPYWAIEFTIQSGPYVPRKVWTNCMLFEGALYTYAQLVKGALGLTDQDLQGDHQVVDPNDLIGKEVVCGVVKKGEQKNAQTGETYDAKNEVKGIRFYDASKFKVGATQTAAVKSGGKSSLLP
jgi:hypothetical protein